MARRSLELKSKALGLQAAAAVESAALFRYTASL